MLDHTMRATTSSWITMTQFKKVTNTNEANVNWYAYASVYVSASAHVLYQRFLVNFFGILTFSIIHDLTRDITTHLCYTVLHHTRHLYMRTVKTLITWLLICMIVATRNITYVSRHTWVAPKWSFKLKENVKALKAFSYRLWTWLKPFHTVSNIMHCSLKLTKVLVQFKNGNSAISARCTSSFRMLACSSRSYSHGNVLNLYAPHRRDIIYNDNCWKVSPMT